MLIAKPLSENDVVTIKLMSSEELVARYKGEDANTYIVSKPLALTLMPNPQTGETQPAFVPYTISVEITNDVRIPKSAVMLIGQSRKDAAAAYTQQTSRLTVPANPGLVVP
jgi:hypothetical protein